MKKYKGIIILSCVVVLLVAAYVFLISAPEDVSDTPSEYSVTDIYNIESDSVKSMKFTSENEVYTLIFQDDNVSIPEIPGATIDAEKAKDLKFTLSYMTTTEVIDENPENLAEFGLENPSYTFEISNGTETYTVYVGDKSPARNGYYCKAADENRVFTITDTLFRYISTPSSYFRTVSFFEVDRETISDVNLDIYGKHNLVFKENVVKDTDTPHNVFNKYQMISPYNWPVSGDMIGKILDSVTQIEVVEYAAESLDNMAEFGFLPYVAKLTFSHDGGVSDTIYFGNNKEGVIYIRVNNDNRIYGVSYQPFSYLELEPFSYLSNFAFLRNIMTVKNLSYKNGDVKASFALKAIDSENVDVKKDGKLVSQDKFKDLYIELISISVAGEYREKNFDEPFLTYNFEYNDGTAEKVEFCKIDERRAALIVNGECQFYVNTVELNQKVEKINELISSF